jgi:hypothetical protein
VLRDDLDLGVEKVEQLPEVTALDVREVETCKPLALRDRRVSTLNVDAKRVARGTGRR